MTETVCAAPDRACGRFPAEALALLGGLAVANIAAWLWAFTLFIDRPAIMATALLAWMFGLRHAVDADHIAAIDNVVRKLMHEGRRPRAAGLFFSLGHSTIVVLGSLGIAVAAAALRDELEPYKSLGGIVGTSVSAAFLFLIAGANLVILCGVWRSFREVVRGGALDHENLDILMSGRGFLSRIFRPLFRAVGKSWHMYLLGFLFGIGFDTATEIGLLSISAAEAARGMSPWQTLVFPTLFTAGMAFVDTLDSILMVGVYGWAFVNPIRKLWYNLTITAASVVVAVVIGVIEALGLVGQKLGLEGTFWQAVADLNSNLTSFGFVVVGIFLFAWLGSALIYRLKGYDQIDYLTGL